MAFRSSRLKGESGVRWRRLLSGVALLGGLVWGILPAWGNEMLSVPPGIVHCVRALYDRFRQTGGGELAFSESPSGAAAQQMASGARFDLLIFTEPKWPKWLLERGLLEKTTVFARGCLVLWWPQPEAPSLDLLRRGTVAVPDPEITGYGMLAKAYLDREGLWQQGLASRRILVLSSGPQTVTAVESGTVQSALMSLTLVRKLSGGFSLVPGASIDQVVGVAPGAGPEARRFAEFLCSENARALLEQGGFVVPQAPEERP